MSWDINNFMQQLRQGFGPGQEKAAEEEKLMAEQQRIQQEGASGELKQAAEEDDLEFRKKKNQIELLKELIKLFDAGKKKKNADGTEVDEPNPVLELLKRNFTSTVGGDYDNPVQSMAQVPSEIPQEYTPQPEVDPYNPVPKMRNSVATTTNDIVGNIAEGGQDYLNSGNLEDYLKRYLNG